MGACGAVQLAQLFPLQAAQGATGAVHCASQRRQPQAHTWEVQTLVAWAAGSLKGACAAAQLAQLFPLQSTQGATGPAQWALQRRKPQGHAWEVQTLVTWVAGSLKIAWSAAQLAQWSALQEA